MYFKDYSRVLSLLRLEDFRTVAAMGLIFLPFCPNVALRFSVPSGGRFRETLMEYIFKCSALNWVSLLSHLKQFCMQESRYKLQL